PEPPAPPEPPSTGCRFAPRFCLGEDSVTSLETEGDTSVGGDLGFGDDDGLDIGGAITNGQGKDGYQGNGAPGVVAVSFMADGSTVVNAGTIRGGHGKSGQADAVDFFFGGNTLELHDGYDFVG